MNNSMQNVHRHPALKQDLAKRMGHTSKRKIEEREEKMYDEHICPLWTKTQPSSQTSDISSMARGRPLRRNKRKRRNTFLSVRYKGRKSKMLSLHPYLPPCQKTILSTMCWKAAQGTNLSSVAMIVGIVSNVVEMVFRSLTWWTITSEELLTTGHIA